MHRQISNASDVNIMMIDLGFIFFMFMKTEVYES